MPSIKYSRPKIRDPKSGEPRKIIGNLVPYGEVWRAGANEATSFVTTADLEMAGTKVPAGNYTLYALPQESGQWKLIISKKTGQWGIPYPKGEDLGRAPMTIGAAPKAAEQLTIGVQDTSAGGTLHIDWGGTRASIPFTLG